MTNRSRFVFLDNEPLCVDRTRVAAQLAARLDCHLVGIAPTGTVGQGALDRSSRLLQRSHLAEPGRPGRAGLLPTPGRPRSRRRR